MSKRFFNILVIALLALTLMGAPAFAFSPDCGMDCCRPPDRAGAAFFEAPSCCNLDGVTCGFEAGRFEALLDEALCCPNSGNLPSDGIDILSFADSYLAHTRLRTHPPTFNLLGSQPTIPVYLSNAAILC